MSFIKIIGKAAGYLAVISILAFLLTQIANMSVIGLIRFLLVRRLELPSSSMIEWVIINIPNICVILSVAIVFAIHHIRKNRSVENKDEV